MRKLFTLIVLFTIRAAFAQSPGFQWALKMGGIAVDVANDVCVDPTGNIYSTGIYMSNPFNVSSSQTLNVTGSAGIDLYLTKHDPSGNLIWGGKLWSNVNCEIYDMICDNSGNLFVTGFFVDSIDCDFGIGTTYLTGLNSAAFVAKYNASGNLIWARKFSGNVGNCGAQGTGIAVDASGNVFVTGYFQETIDFDPGPGSITLNASNSPNADIFLLKLNSLGNLIWVGRFGSNGDDKSEAIAIDASNNILITGKFQNTVNFSTGPSPFNLSAPGANEMYVAKYDSNGSFIWAGQMGGGAANITVKDLKVDAVGSVYAAGWYGGIMDFDPSAAVNTLTCSAINGFIVKLNSNGKYKWAHQIGGSNADEINGIAIDNKCNVYATGYFQLTCDFDPGPGTYTYTTPGFANNIFNMKLDSTGAFVWANHMSGTALSLGNSIAVDLPGNVYTVGSFDLLVDFNPFAAASNLISYGNDDAFIQKLNQGPSNVEVISLGDEIIVYPNPTFGKINIRSGMNAPFEIVIYNILGQKVHSESVAQEQVLIDLEFLPKGIYTYIITSDSKQTNSGKLIID